MIQVIHKALDILEFIAEEPENPKTLSEIAENTGLKAATCAHITKTLVNRSYLDKKSPAKGYTLGPMAYNLTRHGPYLKNFVEVAKPLVAKLAIELQETVLIVTLNNNRKNILCQVDGNQEWQVKSDSLILSDIYESATGRLLLAYLSAVELQVFINENGLPKNVWPGVETSEDLSAVLKKIRNEGMVIDKSRPQIIQIAFPIRKYDKVIAALGMFLPEYRFTSEHRERIFQGIQATAQLISSQLNGN